MNVSVGNHLLATVQFYDDSLLTHENQTLGRMINSCKSAGVTVIGNTYHQFGKDNDVGYTYVILLAESHVSMHTWPEHGFACLDIFTCGTVDPEDILSIFGFQCGGMAVINKELVKRGS